MENVKEERDTCSCNVIHSDIVDKVKAEMPAEERLAQMAELFKVFGDFTRVKIICALLDEEMCVCDIASLLDMSQSAISHQLRVLRHARLVKYRREGRVVYYSLDDEHVKNIFGQSLLHVSHR
ncbi:MAG: metalloregulator ArsR/SmtB family transcription factor [Bacillota bacterium]|nr:metalloregulator ArsR/SmtB family transcription factor [Bacillota bacterium]